MTVKQTLLHIFCGCMKLPNSKDKAEIAIEKIIIVIAYMLPLFMITVKHPSLNPKRMVCVNHTVQRHQSPLATVFCKHSVCIQMLQLVFSTIFWTESCAHCYNKFLTFTSITRVTGEETGLASVAYSYSVAAANVICCVNKTFTDSHL